MFYTNFERQIEFFETVESSLLIIKLTVVRNSKKKPKIKNSRGNLSRFYGLILDQRRIIRPFYQHKKDDHTRIQVRSLSFHDNMNIYFHALFPRVLINDDNDGI